MWETQSPLEAYYVPTGKKDAYRQILPAEATRRMELVAEKKDLSGKLKHLIMEMISAYSTTATTGEVYQLGRANRANLNLV